MANQKKITQVEMISESINKNNNFILLKYSAVPCQTFDNIRKKIKTLNGSLNIIKNTIFEKTINILSPKNKLFSSLRSKYFPLKEPTAVVFLGVDWSATLKAYYESVKDLKNISFKFGLLDNELFDRDQLIKISQLPTKNQLVAKLLGNFNNPTRRLTYSLKFNINKLVNILKQKK